MSAGAHSDHRGSHQAGEVLVCRGSSPAVFVSVNHFNCKAAKLTTKDAKDTKLPPTELFSCDSCFSCFHAIGAQKAGSLLRRWSEVSCHSSLIRGLRLEFWGRGFEFQVSMLVLEVEDCLSLVSPC